MTSGNKGRAVGLPADWKIKSVRDIGQIRTGPFGTLLKASEYCEFNGVPVISVGEIGPGYFKISDATPRVSEKVVRRLPQYVLRAGDIVFGRKGAVDRSALVSKSQEGWFLGSDGISIRPAEPCYPPYLAFQFQQTEIQSWLLQNATGTTMASLNQKVLSEVAIPYAPASEQRAIADTILDVNAALSSFNELIAKKRDLKQAAMQHLLKRGARLAGHSGEWVERPIAEFSSFVTKGATPTTYGFTWESSGVLFLRSECVSPLGLDLTQSTFISDVAHQTLMRGEVRSGDILMTITGNVGRVVLLSEGFGQANINQHIARIRVNDPKISHSFVFHWLSQDDVRQRFAKMTTGQAYPQISLAQVREMKVPFGMLAEQEEIAAVLDDMDAEITLIEARRDKVVSLKQAMMQQLLTGKIRLT